MESTYITVSKIKANYYEAPKEGEIIECRRNNMRSGSFTAYTQQGGKCGTVSGTIKADKKESVFELMSKAFNRRYYAQVVYSVAGVYICRVIKTREAAFREGYPVLERKQAYALNE